MMKRLHPEAQALLDISKKSGYKPYHELSVHEARQQSDAKAKQFSGEFDFKGTTKNIHIPSKNVQGGIPAIVYCPNKTKKDPPILIYFHGGGLVIGSAVARTIPCQILAQQCESIIVNVEYRLAPEHKFPCMMDDGVEAAEWTIANKCQLGGTANSLVGVFGGSSGGTIAASVSHDVPGINFQILIYPSTVHGESFPSLKEFRGDNDAMMAWFNAHTFEKEADAFNPRMSVCHRERFDHLPPALFILAECDTFRDDSYVYAGKLISAGVPADIFTLQGMTHGFFAIPGACKKSCAEAYSVFEGFVNRMYFGE